MRARASSCFRSPDWLLRVPLRARHRKMFERRCIANWRDRAEGELVRVGRIAHCCGSARGAHCTLVTNCCTVCYSIRPLWSIGYNGSGAAKVTAAAAAKEEEEETPALQFWLCDGRLTSWLLLSAVKQQHQVKHKTLATMQPKLKTFTRTAL